MYAKNQSTVRINKQNKLLNHVQCVFCGNVAMGHSNSGKKSALNDLAVRINAQTTIARVVAPSPENFRDSTIT